MKRIVMIISVIFLTMSCISSKAQIAALTVDNVAHPRTPLSGCTLQPGPVTSVRNTGYDVIQNPLGTKVFQVMVWDGPDARLAWNINSPAINSSVSLTTPTIGYPIPSSFLNMTDMDIVIHNVAPSNNLYIMITGIRTDGFVGWLRFDLSNTGVVSFTPTSSSNPTSGILGTTGKCSSPNIDVNNNGFIGICWSESRDLTVQYDFTPPVIPGGPFTLTVKRGDVFAAFGWIDGRDYFASGSTISGVVNPNGDKVNLHSAPGLSELNESPDIAVKDDLRMQSIVNNDLIPSFITWSHTAWDMANFWKYHDVKVLELLDPRLPSSNIEYTLSTGGTRGYPGIPRIAARPLQVNPSGIPYIYNDDYQIVFSAADVNCTNSGSRILNWGRHNGFAIDPIPVDVTSLFSPVLGTTVGGTNILPVVSYQSFTSHTNNVGNYIIAWEHQRTFSVGLTSSTTRDIIATTMNNRNLLTGVTTVSYVNKRCGIGTPGLTGNQNLPSIAGRYTGKNGYLFWDNNTTPTNNYMAYKLGASNTPGIPSSGALRMVNELENNQNLDLILSPNPTKSSLDVKLTDKNTIEKIEIYNSNGQLVMQKGAVKNNSENIDVSKLANGMYIISVETLSGETLNKEFIKE